jgi:hypothetical protein
MGGMMIVVNMVAAAVAVAMVVVFVPSKLCKRANPTAAAFLHMNFSPTPFFWFSI